MSNQRADVKNPNNQAYVVDHKNSIRQLQRTPDRSPKQEVRLRELQRETSMAMKTQKK